VEEGNSINKQMEEFDHQKVGSEGLNVKYYAIEAISINKVIVAQICQPD
jgi:hypothetical protein